jgi:uncharacterized repeat protein (TIGR03803 family)
VSGEYTHIFESTVFNQENNGIENALPLSTGERIIISSGGAFDVGEIWKVTAQGMVKLYDIQNYPDYAYISETMVDGEDGYVYALNFSVITVNFTGILRFKIDGSSYEFYPASQSGLFRYSQIAKASGGIYGTSKASGTNKGFIYKLRPDLSGVDVIYNFTVDSLGIRPQGELTEGRDGKLYGVARTGGRYNAGVIFRIGQDGSGYTVLHHFKPSNGKNPEGKLVQDSDGWLFGTTPYGGSGPYGVVFKIFEDGSGFEKVLNIANNGGTLSPVIAVDDDYFYVSSGNIAYTYTKGGSLIEPINGFSDVWKIRYSVASDTYISSISDGETNVPAEIDVNMKAIYGAASYTVEVSHTPDFSDWSVFHSSNEFVHLSLEEGTTYYTRVFTSLLPDPGPVVSFTTAMSSARRNTSVEVYPNPSPDGFVLKADPSKVQTITVTESNGNVLYEYQNRTGQLPQNIGQDLRQGVYFLRVKMVDGVHVLRVVKQ